MFRAHVLIIRRSKLYYTASGIITPVGVTIPEAPRYHPPTHNHNHCQHHFIGVLSFWFLKDARSLTEVTKCKLQ